MKTLTQTTVVTLALILLAAGVVPAGDASVEEIRAAAELQLQEAELEQQVKVAAVLAQAQTNQPALPVPPTTTSPAPAPIPEPVSIVNNNPYTLTRSFSFGPNTGSAGTVLVIPSEQTSTEDLITINEDMSVMSRIIEKNLEQARIGVAPGNSYLYAQFPTSFWGGGRGGIQSMYLQGFGALFLMKVDFPLTPPPDTQEEETQTETAEEGDPVWREMRQQMYEPEKVDRRRKTERPEQEYDAGKVENLKTTLIKALKHAANIRSLKPDESVILTVTGSGEATGTTITSARLSGENIIVHERDADGKMRNTIVQGTSLDDIGLSSPAILVIRAKKSDIDEFTKGDLDFDQFRQRTQMFTCPLLGGVAERGDPYNLNLRSRSTGSRNTYR